MKRPGFCTTVVSAVTLITVAILTVCPDDACSDDAYSPFFGLRDAPPDHGATKQNSPRTDLHPDGSTCDASETYAWWKMPIIMECHQKSNRFYFDVGRNACLPLPDGSDVHFSPSAYSPPTDPTLVPTVDVFSQAFHSSSTTETEASSSSSSSVTVRHAPSAHSRWLFEEWRLWEGELPCANRAEILSLKTSPTGIYSGQADGPPAAEVRHNAGATTSFETRGAHRSYLPNNLYELENVCIDEETGSLLEFVWRKGASKNDTIASNNTSSTEPFRGTIEHPYRYFQSGAIRFFHPNNRETIPIRVPPFPPLHGPPNASTDEWHSVMIESLRTYHLTLAHKKKKAHAKSASVMFVDEPALMMILTAYDSYNPGHVFQRVAVASSLSRMLGTRSHIYLSEFVATEEGQEYVSLYTLNKGLLAETSNCTALSSERRATLGDLLPSYLQHPQSLKRSQSVKRDRPRNKHRPWNWRGTELQQNAHNRVHLVATAFATGSIAREHTVGSVYHPLTMSGERGCERMRCAGALAPPIHQRAPRAEGEPKRTKYEVSSFADVRSALANGSVPRERHCDTSEVAAIRRCGRRYISINVALDKKLEQWRAGDTQDYTAHVWSNAARETLREGRRLRKDVWAAKQAALLAGMPPIPMPHSPPPTAAADDDEPRAVLRRQYDWYMGLWRARLIYYLVASSVHSRGYSETVAQPQRAPKASQTQPPSPLKQSGLSDERVLDEYLYEFMSYRLEHEALLAEERKESRTRQLICYRSIYISQNHHKKPGRSWRRGALSIAKAPTIHDAEALKNAYEATVARFGVCSSSDVGNNNDDAAQGDSINVEDVAQANNTNRHAHPLFTISHAERAQLNRALAQSRAMVENLFGEVASALVPPLSSSSSSLLHRALLSDVPLVDLEVAVPEVATFLDRVKSAQREYDELLMRRFRRGETGARPIAALHAARFKARQIYHMSSLFTTMSSTKDGNATMPEFVDFAVQEGLRPERQDPHEAQSSRSAQYNAFLTTDIVFGPHGADMHGSAYVKPSALVFELGVGGFDWHTRDYRSGFFTHLAISRRTGYVKINIDSFGTYPNLNAYMSLPEWRHSLSTAVCSWLSFNAVRLSDEAHDRANKSTNARPKSRGSNFTTTDSPLQTDDQTDFSYLIPWWCRGSSLELVEVHRTFLRKRAADSRISFSRVLPSAYSRWSPSKVASFLARRSEKRFGFAVPLCPPLVPSLTCLPAHNGSPSVACRIVTEITQSNLDRLQNECVRHITTSKADVRSVNLHRVQVLQSFLELSLLIEERRAADIAMLVVGGLKRARGGDAMTWRETSCERGHKCGYAHLDGDVECIRRLVNTVFGLYARNFVIPTSVSPCFVTELGRIVDNRAGNQFLVPSNGATAQPCDSNNKIPYNSSYSDYIFSEMMRMTANTTKNMPAADRTSRFSYGWPIDDPQANQKKNRKQNEK